MKRSFGVLLLTAALAFACPACNDDDNNNGQRASVAETSVASFQPDGGFVTSCSSEDSRLFLAGGRTILAGQPFRSVALPDDVPDDARINAVAVSGECVVAVGRDGLVLHSSDGGVTFARSTDSEVLTQATNLNAVATDGTTVVAVGDSGVIVTNLAADLDTDGTWTARGSGVNNKLNSVIKTGALWVVVGDGVALTSTDLATWTTVDDAGVVGVNHNGVVATQAGDLVVVGDGGSVVVREAGSADFVAVNSGVSANLNGVSQGPQEGAPVIAVGNGGAVISAGDPTVPAGQAGGWTTAGDEILPETGAQETDLRAVCALSEDDVFITGDGQVLRSRQQDGRRIFGAATLGGLQAVLGRSDDDVFYVGLNGLILHRGSDGLQLVPSPTGEDLNDVFAARVDGSTTEAWAVGEAGEFIRIRRDNDTVKATIPSGASPGTPLNGVFGTGASNVFAVGDGGVIWRLTDRENPNWSAQASPTDANLNDVWAVKTDGGFLAVAVAESGEVIVRDQDAGFVPASLSEPVNVPLKAVFGCTDGGLTLFTPGNDGKVFRHTPVLEGGVLTSLVVEDISPNFTGTAPNLLGVWCSSPQRVFVVGDPTEEEGATAIRFDGTQWSRVEDVVAAAPQTSFLKDVFGFNSTVEFVGAKSASRQAEVVLVRQD